MADFFANLVERTLGTAPALQPLLPPTYGTTANTTPSEPPSLDELRDSVGRHDVTSGPLASPKPSAEEPLPFRALLPPTRASEAATVPLEVHTEARLAPPVPAPSLFRPSLAMTPFALPLHEEKLHEGSPPKPEGERSSSTNDFAVAPTPRPVAEPGATVPSSSRLRSEEQQLDLLRRVTARREDTPEQNASALRRSLLVSRQETHFPAATPSIGLSPELLPSELETVRSRRHDTIGMIRPAVTSEQEAISSHDADKSRVTIPPSVATPSIRVNIGRIEVRAVHPPAALPAPKQRTQAGSSLSLEEYLRQRDGR